MTNRFYTGDNDVHSYTPTMLRIVRNDRIKMRAAAGLPAGGHELIPELTFYRALADIGARYGPSAAINNMITTYRYCRIVDPDLDNLDGAMLLVVVWNKVREADAYEPFKLTLDEIASTCLQGITHRLLSDWVHLS